jgi:peptidoglycan/xylan/chitin deacetylase (PgdA/CDA1 family)
VVDARRVAAGVGGLSLAATLVHVLPAASAWRGARCLLAPGLSGVGRPDHIALTFDDGPDPASTPAILDLLDRYGWKATFFLLGSQVRRAGSLAAELVARGHEVAVHGDEHRNHLGRTARWVSADVRAATATIAEATGAEPYWFRPPYGAVAASSLVAARRSGLRTVLWTCWGQDWRADATAQTVFDHIESARRPGATVLLHDSDVTSAPQSWRSTVAALPRLAERWAAEGLRVGTLSEHGIAGAERPNGVDRSVR